MHKLQVGIVILSCTLCLLKILFVKDLERHTITTIFLIVLSKNFRYSWFDETFLPDDKSRKAKLCFFVFETQFIRGICGKWWFLIYIIDSVRNGKVFFFELSIKTNFQKDALPEDFLLECRYNSLIFTCFASVHS